MNKTMKQTIFIFLISFALFSCKKDNDKANVTVSMSGVNATLKASASVKITDFRLSIRDVEFKMDDSDLDSNEVEFRGPYDVDLMSETDALTQTLGTITVPEGSYKVVRFKLHKDQSRAETDVLFDRSIYIAGTINDTPFVFWHDTSENFDAENSSGIQVSAGDINVTVRFVMDQFLNSLHTIDLSQAVDDDEDGIIEINPDDDDNNGDIADKLKENIKEAANLIKL